MLLASLHLNVHCWFFADYHSFTRDNQKELEDTFKFLGTEDPSQALEMLRCDLIAYGLNSERDHFIKADDAPQSHTQTKPHKALLPDPLKEDGAFIQNTQDMVSKTVPDQLHSEPHLSVLRGNRILTTPATKWRHGRPQKNANKKVNGNDEKSPRCLCSGLHPKSLTIIDTLSHYPSLTPPSPTKQAQTVSGCIPGSMRHVLVFIVFLQGHIADQPKATSTQKEKKKSLTSINHGKRFPHTEIVSEKAMFQTRA
jgi:hypothetical protein